MQYLTWWSHNFCHMSTPFNLPEDQISAVHALEGKTLKTGWNVLQRTVAKPGSTGSNFSVCYTVEKDGTMGFLKALNILSFLQGDMPDLPKAMADILNSYNYEREILTRCREGNFSKVSKLLDAGEEHVPGYLVGNVYYMIFEKAEDDVRNHLNFTSSLDTAWKLRSLHHIATGIKQLHSIEISHQDVKPSNVFVFHGNISKVGDLGRSLCQAVSGPHSKMNFAGDPRYAPPEVYQKFVLPDWKERVFAIDCYMLGSMASFYFTGQSMTALLSRKITTNVNVLSMNFENALQYWIAAFDDVLNLIEGHLADMSTDDRTKLVNAIRMLCFPDPRQRGHVKNIKETGSNFQLERFVEIFNLLATKAEFKLTH
jgi:eukaryotic-like serine/threonine-protein kinase